MKTALLHYWLTNERGGEKVLAALGRMYPQADIFTHAFGRAMRDPDRGDGDRWKGHLVRESIVARLPFARRHPQAYLPLMPMATRRLKLEGYELVISSESGPIKGIRKPRGTRHVCYCHTPMRYLWDMHEEYYRAAGTAGRLAMRMFTSRLRKEDVKSADQVDSFIANSAFVAERIRRIYGRDSVVVHPPVDVGRFRGDYEKADNYLLAGELVAYKRPELAISACVRMGRRIVVIGTGKLQRQLARLFAANPLVAFLGRADDEVLKQAYGRARALLFPGVEDFGIVPVEAQAAGTPVIAFRGGGALETVRENVSGLFFSEPSVDSLCAAIEEFEARSWRPEDCRAAVASFGEDRFCNEIARVL